MMTAMGPVNVIQVNIGNNIGIDDHKGLSIPEIGHIFDGAAGAKNFRFVTSSYWNAVALGRNKCFDIVMQVMGVDYNRFAARLLEFINDNSQQGTTGNGEQGFGRVVRIGLQTGTESRRQD
jgi:hypothetical protein